jgi:MtaA/CmuA family methyltransferase
LTKPPPSVLRFLPTMNAKELVSAALQGRPIPRVPTGPLAVHFCARTAGHSLRDYSTSAQTLADSVLRYVERFRPDAVWVSADTWVSAEAMGAQVGACDDEQPLGGVGEPVVRTAADIDRIALPDVGQQGRYPMMLEALTRVVEAFGREVFVVACFDQYPFSLAAALMGLNETMLRVHDDPAFVRALMARCAEYALAYGTAMAQAGADMLSGGDSPAGLLGPRFYGALALPAEQELIAAMQAATGKPVSLHICGDTTPILPLMASSGADVLELDHAVDLGAACRTVGPHTALWGNLDPVGLLAQGTPATVSQAVRVALEAVRASDHRRFVLSSGCTLAVETPPANLEALLRAGR